MDFPDARFGGAGRGWHWPRRAEAALGPRASKRALTERGPVWDTSRTMSAAHGSSTSHSHTPAALPEPKTPMWLPALGVCLFLAAALICGLMPDSKPAADGKAAAPAASAGAARGK